MPVKNLVVETLLLILGQALFFTQNVISEESVIEVGVYILYDRGIYNQIISDHGHDIWADERKPDDYFAAFLRAVELRFRNMSERTVKISLVKSSLLGDSSASKIEVTAPGYYETLNGSETIRNLQEEVSTHAYKYGEGDALFLVTTQTVLTKDEHNEWLGMAKQGGICDPSDKVGLVTDDGKTFKGVQDMALQTALLLNASKDEIENGCNKSEHHLLSTIYTGDLSYLSECSKNDIVKYIKTNTKDCINTPPKKISNSERVFPATYHNNTGYDICASRTSGINRDVNKCLPGIVKKRPEYPCRVQCCEYSSRFTIRNGAIFVGWEKLADGTPCGDSQICIHGKCEYTA